MFFFSQFSFALAPGIELLMSCMFARQLVHNQRSNVGAVDAGRQNGERVNKRSPFMIRVNCQGGTGIDEGFAAYKKYEQQGSRHERSGPSYAHGSTKDPSLKLKRKIADYKSSGFGGRGPGLAGSGPVLAGSGRGSYPTKIRGLGGGGYPRILSGSGNQHSYNGRAVNLTGGGVSRADFIKQHGAGKLASLKAQARRAANATTRAVRKYGPGLYRGARKFASQHAPYIMENIVKPGVESLFDGGEHGRYLKDKVVLPAAERYVKGQQRGGFFFSLTALIAAASAAFAALPPAVASGITAASTALGTYLVNKAIEEADKAMGGRGGPPILSTRSFTEPQKAKMRELLRLLAKNPSAKPMVSKMLGPIFARAFASTMKGRGLKLAGTGCKRRKCIIY